MGLNYHNLRLVDIINNGVPQETLVKTTAKGERDVLALIAKDFPTDHVTNIKTVKNSFLEALFLLKKEEMKSRYGQVQELLLIHVTGAAAVESICSNNFDWRRVRRGKFGIGNSFSPDADYANRYANYDIGKIRAFIITRVLVSKITTRINRDKMPLDECDTVISKSKKVYVKFHDHEVLPCYVVNYCYSGAMPRKLRLGGSIAQSRRGLQIRDDTEHRVVVGNNAPIVDTFFPNLILNVFYCLGFILLYLLNAYYKLQEKKLSNQ